MSKVANCKGSYRKRKNSNKYQIIVPLGYNELRKQYDRYYEDVENEAEAILAIKDINNYLYFGGTHDSEKIANYRKYKPQTRTIRKRDSVTFDDVAKEFIEISKNQKIYADRTIQMYETAVKRVRSFIGSKPIIEIKPHDIDVMYATMRKGTKTHKPYSGTTLKTTHIVLKHIFDKACAYEYIDINPFNKITKPKIDTEEKEPLSVMEAQRLYLFCIDSHNSNYKPYTIGILLGLLAGLRLSEMLALEWKDYNRQVLKISKSLERDSNFSRHPKNNDTRIVTCPPSLITQLNLWKAEQKQQFAQIGLTWYETTPIIATCNNTHIYQSNFRRWLIKHMDEFPTKPFTFHILRHSYVTFLFRDCGIDETTVCSLSGHRTNEAFRLYAHTNSTYKQDASRKLSSIIAPNDIKSENCRNCSMWAASPIDINKGTCWFSNKAQETTGDSVCNNFRKDNNIIDNI